MFGYNRFVILALVIVTSAKVFASVGGVTLPGTTLLRDEGDLTQRVVEGATAFMSNEVMRVAGARDALWNPNHASRRAYETSVEPNRKRFRFYIGLADPRADAGDLELVATVSQPALVAETEKFSIFAVRWPVLAGVDAEGLLLEPKGRTVAQVVVLPDADWAPESVAGLDQSFEGSRQVARRLAESGCRVLVPTMIDRSAKWSGHPSVRPMGVSHRDFIYILGYTASRHIIGYEVQRTLAAVDYFKSRDASAPVGVVGCGEGGLIAFYSAAADTRIDAAMVSGYFQEREEELFLEPNYRNVWGLLHEFGDAGIARLIAPRGLAVEAARGPEVSGRPGGSSAAPGRYGRLTSPRVESVRREFDRAARHYTSLGAAAMLSLTISGDGQGKPFADDSLGAFARWLNIEAMAPVMENALSDLRRGFDPAARLRRQYDQLVAHSQEIMRMSPLRRAEFWGEAGPAGAAGPSQVFGCHGRFRPTSSIPWKIGPS